MFLIKGHIKNWVDHLQTFQAVPVLWIQQTIGRSLEENHFKKAFDCEQFAFFNPLVCDVIEGK